MRRAQDAADASMKPCFLPGPDKSAPFARGHAAEHSGHSRGSTAELTLFDMRAEKEADMGGTFDRFGERSHPDFKGATREQYADRMLLREAMTRRGFRPLPEEWRHFTPEGEPYPDTCSTVPASETSVARSSRKQQAQPGPPAPAGGGGTTFIPAPATAARTPPRRGRR